MEIRKLYRAARTGRRLKLAGAALIAAAVLFSTAACGGNAGGSGNSPEVSIMVGGLNKVIYLPAKLTEQLGYFKDEGLNVTLLEEQSGANSTNAVLAGQVNGAVGFYDHTIMVQPKGQCIQSVVQFANIPGEAEVISTKNAAAYQSMKDLEGKNLGMTSFGSSTDFLTQALAGQAGVQNYTPVKVGAGPPFIAQLQQGSIDAGMTTDPTIAQLESSGEGKVLVEMRTAEGTKAALGGLYPASSLYMSCDYVQKNPETVQKLANALVKTLRYINANDAATIAAKMPADYAAAGKELYEKSVNDSKGIFNQDGKMDPEGAKNVLRILDTYAADLKGKGGSIDMSKTYTTQFVDKVPAG